MRSARRHPTLTQDRSGCRWQAPARVYLLCAALALAGAEGCAFSRGDLGEPLKDSELSEIKNGQTTEAQVVSMLGAPQSVEELNHGVVFHYYRYSLRHASILVFSRINIASDNLYVFFDHDGVVDQVLSGNQTDKLKFQFWPFGG